MTALVGLVPLAQIAYVTHGLPDEQLGVAWPSMRADIALPRVALGMLLVASARGYLTMSFSSIRIMAWLGDGGPLVANYAA
ncbi:MAG: hypothetical protein WAV74_10740 [Anaerolineae bacterium]